MSLALCSGSRLDEDDDRVLDFICFQYHNSLHKNVKLDHGNPTNMVSPGGAVPLREQELEGYVRSLGFSLA